MSNHDVAADAATSAGDRRRTRSLDRSLSVHVTLPEALAVRVRETADRLGISRSLVAREAIERGLKPATDALRAKVRRLRSAGADAGADASADA